MRLQPRKNKLTRLEKRFNSVNKRTLALQGKGLFRYRNNLKADLQLPKPCRENVSLIPPGGIFTGDDYFQQLIGKGVVLMENLEPVAPPVEEPQLEQNLNKKKKGLKKENKEMIDEKLILDQPDRVTTEGKTEQVIKTPPKKLNEGQPEEGTSEEGEKLLVDDALSGIEILHD